MVDEPLPTINEPIDRDVMCIGCGYNLRGLRPLGDCPECGLRLDRSLRRGPEPVVDEWRIQTGMAIRLETWVAICTAGCCAFGGLVGILNHEGLTQPHPGRNETVGHILMRQTIAWMRLWLLLLLVACIYLLHTLIPNLDGTLMVSLLIVSTIRFGVVYCYLAELADRYDAPREAWLMRAAALAQVVTQTLAGVAFAFPGSPWGWLVIVPIACTLALSVYAINRVADFIEPPEPDTSLGHKTPPLRM